MMTEETIDLGDPENLMDPARTDRLAKEMIEARWPAKKEDGPDDPSSMDKCPEAYRQRRQIYRNMMYQSLQKGMMIRELRRQADEFAEIEYHTASTGEWN